MFAPAWVPAVFVFVDGFQSVGLWPWPNEGHHSTLPVGRSWGGTVLYGRVVTDENPPTVAGPWAVTDEIAIKCATPNQPSAINRTFNLSAEHEQDFSAR